MSTSRMNSIETDNFNSNQIEQEIFFKILSKKYSLSILNELIIHDKRRFNSLVKSFEKTSTKTISSRLKELAEHGLIIREQFNEIPPRVEYSITSRGMDVVKKIDTLLMDKKF